MSGNLIDERLVEVPVYQTELRLLRTFTTLQLIEAAANLLRGARVEHANRRQITIPLKALYLELRQDHFEYLPLLRVNSSSPSFQRFLLVNGELSTQLEP